MFTNRKSIIPAELTRLDMLYVNLNLYSALTNTYTVQQATKIVWSHCTPFAWSATAAPQFFPNTIYTFSKSLYAYSLTCSHAISPILPWDSGLVRNQVLQYEGWRKLSMVVPSMQEWGKVQDWHAKPDGLYYKMSRLQCKKKIKKTCTGRVEGPQ